MKSRFTKLTAFILAITLTLPFTVFAAAQDEKAASDGTDIAYELTELRNEFEKHFLMSDGTVVAATYAEPVNYYDKAEDVWKEIDNTLTHSNGRYRNKGHGGFDVSFRGENTDGDMVEMSDGSHTISWTVSVQNEFGRKDTVKNQIDASVKQERSDSGNKFAAERAGSAIKYNSPFSGNKLINVDYTVSQYKVKEDITIYSSKDGNAIHYTYNCGELTAVLNPDNSIDFVDREGEPVYTVHKPYMYDSAGNGSYDFSISLKQQGGVCTVVMTPDKAWLDSADRVYPVVIDPTVTTSNYSSTYFDTYVSSAYPNTNYSSSDKLNVGNLNGGTNRIYLYISPPTIPTGSQILDARLDMALVYDTTTAATFDIAQINSGWNVNSITYNSAGAYTIIESEVLAANLYRDVLSFNLRSYYQSYYENITARYGFVIKYHDETYDDFNVVYSNEYTDPSKHPMLTIVYAPQTESESNDTTATANEIDISPIPGRSTTVQGGSSTVPGTYIDYDYFKFTVPRHGKITVSLTCIGDVDYNVHITSHSIFGTTSLGNFTTASVSPTAARRRGSTTFTATKGAVQEDGINNDVSSPDITYYIRVYTTDANASDYLLQIAYSSSYANLDWIYPIAGTQSTLNSIQYNEITNVSSPVGYRTYDSSYHQGMDISVYKKTLKAVADGVVVRYQEDPSAGRHLVIYTDTIDPHNSSNHLVVVYMHMDSKLDSVIINQPVAKGQDIGISGDTGSQGAFHLHFEVYSTAESASYCGGRVNSRYTTWLINPYEIYYDDVVVYGTPY